MTLALSSRHSIANLPFICHRSPPVLSAPQLLPVFTSLLKKRNPKRLKYYTQRLYKDDRMPMLYVEMDPLRVDTWKLEPVIELIKDGAVGVIPTDTVYSIVCDLKSHSSIVRLRRIKDMRSSKGLDFIVDGGTRIADPSTVVDMMRNPPTIIRQGKGPKQDWMVVEGEDSNV